jgi:hypothetical protein
LMKVAEPSWRIVCISSRPCLGALDVVRCGCGHRNDPMDQTGHVAATGLPRPRSQRRQYPHKRRSDDAATRYGVAVPFNCHLAPKRRLEHSFSCDSIELDWSTVQVRVIAHPGGFGMADFRLA